MNNARGQILSFVEDDKGSRAVVGVAAGAACARCAAGKGCGAALFAGTTRRVEASVPQGLNLAVGDFVELSLRSDELLRAAFIVYGLPLLTAVIAVTLAYFFSLDDRFAAYVALAGLLSGAVIARQQLRKHRCLRRFVPTIAGRLDSAEATS